MFREEYSQYTLKNSIILKKRYLEISHAFDIDWISFFELSKASLLRDLDEDPLRLRLSDHSRLRVTFPRHLGSKKEKMLKSKKRNMIS